MRDYPHKPKKEYVEESLQDDRSTYGSMLPELSWALGGRKKAWFFDAWRRVLDIASVEYAFEAPFTKVRARIITSCEYAEKAVEFGYPIGPAYYKVFLCHANLCNLGPFRARLESMERLEYLRADMKNVHELTYLTCELLAALSAGEAVRVGDSLARALPLVEPSDEVHLGAFTGMVKAILEHDPEGLDVALQNKIKGHMQAYSTSTDVRNYPGSLLDLTALGMLKIAKRYGVETTVQSVYVPLELLKD